MVDIPSEDWQDIKSRVRQLELDRAELRGAVDQITTRLDTLTTQQATEHRENQAGILKINLILEGEGDDNPGVKMKVDRLENLVRMRFDDVMTFMRTARNFFAWIVATALIIIGLWFSWLEYRHAVQAKSDMPGVQSKQIPQVEAGGAPPAPSQ